MKQVIKFLLLLLLLTLQLAVGKAQESIVQYPVSGNWILIGKNQHPNLDPNAESSLLNTSTGELTTIISSSQVDRSIRSMIWAPNYQSLTYVIDGQLNQYYLDTDMLQLIPFASGYGGHSLWPIGWNLDDVTLLLSTYSLNPSTEHIGLFDTSLMQFTQLFEVSLYDSIAGWLPLPTQWVDATFISFRNFHRNPVHLDWVSFIVDIEATDNQGEKYGDRLGYVYNYVTQQAILINISPVITMSAWDTSGRYLLVTGTEYSQVIEVLNIQSAPILSTVQTVQNTEDQTLLQWLGVSDLAISGLNNTYYIGQMINGTWHSTEFLRFSSSDMSITTEFAWQPTFGEQEAYQLSCLFDQALPTQLSVGARARVNFTDGTPLRLRDTPSFDANEITQMPEGTEFDIIGGKACVNEESYYRFWQLELDNGTIGWAAEANLTDYFMEPVPTTSCNATIPASDTTALINAITTANGAGSPQTICLEQGTYTLTVSNNSASDGANGLPVITGDITIVGNGATVTRDAAAPAFRLFSVAQGASLSLDNITLSNGYLDAGFNGGGILNNGTLNIAASNITGNTAGGLGGGVYNTGTITSDGSGIHGNTSGQDGGGLYNTGSFTITNGGLFGNSASGNGGAIFNTGSASVSLFNSGMENNTAPNGQGGAIYNQGTSFTLSSSGLYNNTSSLDGAGVYNTGGFTVTSSGIGSNTSGLNGGGVFNSGTLNVTYSSLNSNTVSGSGGGLYQSPSGLLTLSDGEMNLNNASSGLGAGLYNEGSLNLSHAGFGSNVTNFDGAGIYSSGTLAGDNLSITYNTTGNLGGGLYNDGTFTLTLVTFNNNQSSTGGALYTTTAANNSVTQSCVTNNIATDTSGIFSDVAPLQADSIWWGAADGPSGAGSGTGDAVNGNVTYQPFWTEGCGTSGSQSLTQTSQQSSTDSTSQNSSEVVPPFRSQIQNANNWRADSAWTFGSNVGRQGGGWTIRAAKASDQSNLEFNRRFNLRNTTNPRLSFMQKANLAPYDTIIVEVQPQFSRGWIPLDRQQGLETDWQLREIDLSAYRGQSIRLRWRILTTGLTPQAETQDGFWLDDLAVEDVR